jgi:hypothetical protein
MKLNSILIFQSAQQKAVNNGNSKGADKRLCVVSNIIPGIVQY